MHRLKPLMLLLVCIALAGAGQSRLAARRQALRSAAASEQEVLYLPSGKGVQALSFGYPNVLADVLWFNAVSYFGKHYRSDQQYRWLSHMCNLITDLDGRAEHVYEFCSLMLAWELGKPEEAVGLLDKALRSEPDNWRYYYLRGINYAFFLGDPKRAREDFAAGAAKPEALPLLARLAAKQFALEDPMTALRFLENMIEQAQDETQRAALVQHHTKALREVHIRAIENVLAAYVSRTGAYPPSLEALAAATQPPLPLEDPCGGRYFIDPQTHAVASTSTVARINFFRKGSRQ